jgi:transposase
VLQDLWRVRLSLGTVVRQEQAQSAALAPAVAEARAAVQHAPVVNMEETDWRQAKQRGWPWTVLTDELSVFRIERSRSRAVVEALPGTDFAGVVGSDCWSAYRQCPA